MTGTLTGATWEGERTITFEFNEDNVTGSEETTQGGGGNNEGGNGNEGSGNTPSGETTEGSAPAVGTNYQGAYVLRSMDNGDNTVTVTLMSFKQKRDLECNFKNLEEVEEAVNEAIIELSVDGIDGWRLPTTEELDYLNSNFSEVNSNLSKAGIAYDRISSSNYYFIYNDGNLSLYRSAINNYSTNFTTTDIVRAFTTLTFNK